ncbi:MAG TPA: fibronectin type III domain-containing protein [Thermoanaerobaculia bacterium]|nr:fibronectin type III domain-containing protein [Thermoanaerobaculia bacterium]
MNRLLAAVLLCALTTSAQAIAVGGATSLTNVRYGPASPTAARVVSTGDALYLFWISGRALHLTPLDGSRRIGEEVVGFYRDDLDPDFDVVWNGEHFVVATRRNNISYAEHLNRDGTPATPAGGVGVVATRPRLAIGDELTMFASRHADGVLSTITVRRNGYGVSTRGTTQIDDLAVAGTSKGYLVLTSNASGIDVTTFAKNGERLATRTLAANVDPLALVLVRNGDSVFAAWMEYGGGGTATLLDADGNAGPFVRFAENTPLAQAGVTGVWSGSEYLLAYHASDRSLRVAHFDAAARMVQTETRAAGAHAAAVASVAMHQGRAFVAWNPASPAVLETLPLAFSEPVPVTFDAIPQRLLTTAHSSFGTLVVWEEPHDDAFEIRAGVRGYDGTWRESLVSLEDTRVDAPLAASDRSSFVLVLGARAIPLDARGSATGTVTPLPFAPTGMAWNGTTYALIGVVNQTITGLSMNASGVWSRPVVVAGSEPTVSLHSPAIASDGDGFLAVWVGRGIVGARLDAKLERLGAEELFILATLSRADVAWNGGGYTVAAGAFEGAFVAHVRADGTIESRDYSFTSHRDAQTVPRLGGGSAVVWWDTDENVTFPRPPVSPRHRVAAFREDGVLLAQVLIDDEPQLARIVPMPGGRIGYITNARYAASERIGSQRVQFLMIDPYLSSSLGGAFAPAASAREEHGRARVEWTPSPHRPVTGYRIELRTGGGAWTELEAWFDASVRSTLLDVPNGTSFRVRAFNEWGESGTSLATPPIDPRTSKRRSAN